MAIVRRDEREHENSFIELTESEVAWTRTGAAVVKIASDRRYFIHARLNNSQSHREDVNDAR